MAEEDVTNEGLKPDQFNPDAFIQSPGDYGRAPTTEDTRTKYADELASLQDARYQISGGLVGKPYQGTQPDFTKTGEAGNPFYSAQKPLYDGNIGGEGSQGAAERLLYTMGTTPLYAHNDFKFTAQTEFGTNKYHYNIKRYKAAPGDNFDKLGFSPWRDNEAYYDDHMSDWDDGRRASKAFWNNLGTGFKSYFDFGGGSYYKDVETAEQFSEDAALYNSRRGSTLGMLGNTVGQSGLGVGMALGFLAETATVSLLTGGSGGAANIGRGTARMSLKLPKLLSLGKKWKNTTKFLQGFKSAEGLRGVWQSTRAGGAKFVKGVGSRMTPNTYQWGKTIKNVDDLKQFGNWYKGFGYFYKDYAIAKMAMSESRMEGGLVYQETEERLLQEFRAKHKRDPNLTEWGEIQLVADEAAKSTFNQNFPLIYGTNMLVFNRMFKGFGSNMFRNFDKTWIRNAAGKVVINPKAGATVAKTGFKAAWGRTKTALISPRAWGKTGLKLGKGFWNYTKANFGEGVQEVAQEVISDSASDYYSSVYWSEHGDATVGDYYQMTGHNIKKYMSPAGAEIFMSGFLMGGIMGGGQRAISFSGEQAVKRGLVGKTRKEKYAAYQTAKEKELQKVADSYNKIMEDPMKFFNPKLQNVVAQRTIGKEMEIAEELGDKKSFVDLREDSEFFNVKTAIETGNFDVMIDQLKDFKNLSLEEFEQATGVKVQDKAHVNELVEGMIERAKDIKEGYEDAITRFPNNHNPWQYNPGSKEQRIEAFRWQAHNSFIEQYALAGTKFRRAVERKGELYNKLKKKPWYRFKKFRGVESTGIKAQSIDLLLDPGLMGEENRILNMEIAELKERAQLGTITPEEKKQLKRKEELKKVYSDYHDARDRYKAAIEAEEIQYDGQLDMFGRYSEEQIKEQEDALKELQKAWTSAIKTVAKIENQDTFDTDIDDAFIEVKDMIELEDDTSKFKMAVNYLTAPGVYEDFITRDIEVMEGMVKRRAEMLAKHLDASFQRRENGAFEDILQNQGFVLTEEGYERIYDEASLPNEFIDISQGLGEVVTAPSSRYNEGAALVEEFLTGVRKAGVTAEEYDVQLKEEQVAAGEAEAAGEEVDETVAPEKLTMLDEAGNSNFSKWADVEGLQQEATELFEKAQARRQANPNLEEYESIDAWVTDRPEDLAALLGKYNRSRNEEYKKSKAEKAQQKREAEDAKKKAKQTEEETSEEPVEEGLSPEELSLAQMKRDLAEEEERVANGEGSQEVIDELKAGISELEEYIKAGKVSQKPPQDKPGSGPIRTEQATGESYFTPKGNTVQEKVDSVITELQKNQKNVKKLSDLTEAERKKYGVKEGAHGYLVKVGKEWVRATSVTQAMGTTFELQEGNRVEVLDTGETAQILEGPVESDARMKENMNQDTYLVKMEESGEEVELTRNQLKNITYVDSTIAGTKVDDIVRDFFLNKIPDDAPVPEGIDPKAFRELINTLREARAFFETNNLTVLANNIILFDANAPGGVIAGEIDLLAYNNETGRFYIYDMKTSKAKFWEVDPKTGGLRAPKLNPKFAEEVHENTRGLSRSKKHGYELQQSIYKNLFEKQYGAMIGTKSESGIALLPFHITYDKTGKVKTLKRESDIPLNYRPEAETWVDSVEVEPIGFVEEEGTGVPIQPEVLEGGAFETVEPGLQTVDIPFDKGQHQRSLNAGTKVTTVRTERATPKLLQGLLDAALVYVGGTRYKAISYGKLNNIQAGQRIKKIAEDSLRQIEILKAQSRPGTPKGLGMTEAMANKILAVDKMDLNDEDKAMMRIAISEGLPTALPEGWKENPITIGGKKFYAKFPRTIKWMRGSGKMVLIHMVPAPEIKMTPEMQEDQYNAYDHFAEKVNKTDDPNDLKVLEQEISKWVAETTAETLGQVTGVQKISDLLTAKKAELEFRVGFSSLEKGDIITINSAEIGNFGEKVTILNVHPNYVTVRNEADPKLTTKENGKPKTIAKSKFDSVVAGVNEQGTMEVQVEEEEKKATEENVENAGSLSVEERQQLIEDNKEKSADDILGDIADSANENCS
jgi:hypothetical protein